MISLIQREILVLSVLRWALAWCLYICNLFLFISNCYLRYYFIALRIFFYRNNINIATSYHHHNTYGAFSLSFCKIL